MPQRGDIINFGAGPAAMPDGVMSQAAQDLLNYRETGMGIGELSHRSAMCNARLQDIKAALKRLLDIPDTHSVLFMQGGGTTQFAATVYNLMAYWVARDPETGASRVGDYLVTGSWSKKAVDEAKRLGVDVNIVADARKATGEFGTIPPASEHNYTPKERAAYVWYCDNETIDGVEFPGLPEGIDEDVPLVCDMSSNFASRKVDVARYAVIYAGAQKNVGLAGITVCIVRNDILEKRADAAALHAAGAPVPAIMLDYQTIWKNDSLYNTLPIFALHVVGLVFEHLLHVGGMQEIERVNAEKAELLYDTLDRHSNMIEVVPSRGARSRMNVVFKFVGEDAAEREKQFLKLAESKGMVQLKGHRSVGGLRASLYNAITLDDTRKLAAHVDEICQ